MSKIFKEIKYLPEFEKDFKKLLKKFKTLNEDLQVFVESQLNLYHKYGKDNGGIFQITNLGIEYPKIYKARKFACKSLKGKGAMSGIRAIYAYYEDMDIIEFIELYFKGEKENEDRNRIIQNYKGFARKSA